MGRLRRIGRARRALPPNVRALGWVSFANDFASELIYPVLPLFLTITLGAPVAILGLIEGIAEGVAVGLRGVAGWLSDRAGERRRPWIIAGYALSALARPVIAAAPAWGYVLGGRLGDRLGKAARTAPRDALIRDSTPPALVGASFGYHRAMDTAGAVVGPLIAVLLLASGWSLRSVLWVAVVPGLLTLVFLARVREAPKREETTLELDSHDVRRLPRPFWLVLAVWTLFSLGNSSDVFLILRAHDLGLSATLVILAYALYNLVYSALSWPLGALSDRVARTSVLTAGLAVFALVYLGFAVAPGSWAVWPLFAVYGVYIAATDGVAKAWVADFVPPGAAGTAYGLFAAASGGALLLASVVAGLLWSRVSPEAPFVLGAATAACALVLIVLANRTSSLWGK
ncbi:MAG: MFS transporter [Actinobacteria bacterium]|nr:MFS transporter [Actinomycetota bacterium]